MKSLNLPHISIVIKHNKAIKRLIKKVFQAHDNEIELNYIALLD